MFHELGTNAGKYARFLPQRRGAVVQVCGRILAIVLKNHPAHEKLTGLPWKMSGEGRLRDPERGEKVRRSQRRGRSIAKTEISFEDRRSTAGAMQCGHPGELKIFASLENRRAKTGRAAKSLPQAPKRAHCDNRGD